MLICIGRIADITYLKKDLPRMTTTDISILSSYLKTSLGTIQKLSRKLHLHQRIFYLMQSGKELMKLSWRYFTHIGSKKKRTPINDGQSKHERRLPIPGVRNITSIVISMLRKEDIKPLQFQRMLSLCPYLREQLQISS